MKKLLISISQVLISTLVLFVILELVFRLFSVPGASEFVEKIVIRERLTREKPRDEIRIFTYGESTMHGAQYGPTASPAR